MPGSDGHAETLRLLTWNVHDLLGDPLAVARVIASADADVVCLQEAPRWPLSRCRLARLARSAGLRYAGGGRSAAGCALLVSRRVEVTDVWARHLPVEGWLTRPRGWVLARVRLPGSPSVLVACVHLGLTAAERARHVGLILDGMQAEMRPGEGLVLAGDLNETPGSPSWRALERLVVDPSPEAGPTFPVRGPDRRLDAVLVGPPSSPVEADLVPDAVWAPEPADLVLASDHRPVLAQVGLKAKESGRAVAG
jgi:endonuclease/exonuclease/phosphatase family metal-dependent hydrolase